MLLWKEIIKIFINKCKFIIALKKKFTEIKTRLKFN